MIPRLILVTNRKQAKVPLPELAALAVAGGVDVVQLREKDLPHNDLRALAIQIIDSVGDPRRIAINGDPQLAAELGTGLHLPECHDVILGDVHPLSRSIHSPTRAAASTGCDYVIAGHVYPTGSKPGGNPLGLDDLHEIAMSSSVPVIAIGGISPERVAEVLAAGAAGIAVMSGINDREDPERAAADYRRALEAFAMTDLKRDQIEVTINGKPAFVPDGISVADYLKQRNHHQRLVVVELNGSIIRKESFESASIHAGDKLEIVHFVGGG